jgi:hypothetical protein
MRRRLLQAGAAALTLLAVAAGLTRPWLRPAVPPAPRCDLYASPGGSDAGSGSLSSPLQTVAALDAALAPGQTGCLEAGTYGSIGSTHRLSTSGTASGQITITPVPGQTAKLVGLVEIEGSYTTLTGLTIDGSNDLYDAERSGTSCPYPVSNGLEIDGRHDIFENNDLYQSIASLRGNGIGIGWNSPADDSIIRDNRIHDLGQCMAYDQMIYVAHGTGIQIYDNWLWNDPHGWGVQLYPGATDTHVYDNVIDHAGSGFVIGGSSAVSGNVIDHNIVMNSTGLPDAGLTGVGISTCCGLGPNNTFTNNDVYNNPGGIDNASGITLAENTTTNPQLADPANHDYRPTTTLTAWSLWNGGLSARVPHRSGALVALAAQVAAHRPERPRGRRSLRRVRRSQPRRRRSSGRYAISRRSRGARSRLARRRHRGGPHARHGRPRRKLRRRGVRRHTGRRHAARHRS